ncbi:AraC family transcriptional regulator ligand-binding domain-containing protein [Streptomyces sp. NPDC048277]|uniref:AraC family transcriptional regulator ligand-binding domain-containing protein n=1 Tax=Streptomyces sp. NPDC048277 TaxID=3155027 RepID=UPI0033F2F98D
MAAVYSLALPKMVLARAAHGLRDARRLALEARIPDWAVDDGPGTVTTVSNECFLRTLELAEHHNADPDTVMRIGSTFRQGQLGVYDYLFSSGPTLAEGLATTVRYQNLITGAGKYVPLGGAEPDVRVGIFLSEEEGRGKELAVQIGIADVLGRARWATGRRVDAVEVTLRQPPPRRSVGLARALGTTRVTFGADVDSVRLRAADLRLPLRTADPALAALMTRYADSLPRIAPRPTTWPDRVRQTLAVALAENDASLDAVARRLLTSSRTLQRRLAEAGTTWRQELDRARQELLAARPRTPAARLGYSDARALRRARRRWTAK